jgi:hypothetical protein
VGEQEIKVREVVRRQPDVRLYVLALIALARQLQEEEERREAVREGTDG